jgi:hypothetical protein
VVIGLLSACTDQAALKPVQATDTATALPSTTLLPTFTPTVTSTPLSPDAQTLKDIVFSDCIPVEQSFPVDMVIPWNILVEQENNIYFLNPENGTRMEVPRFSENASDGSREYLFDSHVSPDGKWLAYPDITRKKVFFESVETLVTNRGTDRIIVEKEHKIFIQGWINNDTVLVLYPPSEEGGFFPTVTLNPFTGEEHVFLLEEMPDFLDFHFSNASNYMIGEVVPDPALKRLIYPSQGVDELGIANTLWDIENEKPLANIKFLIGKSNDPLWSQDGSDVVLMGPNQDDREEWFLITSNGIIRQITNFSDIFQDSPYYIYSPNRSGDGEYLFFQFIYNEPNKIAKYVLLNIKKNENEGFCINLNDNARLKWSIWTPDSKFLIIISQVINENEKNILIDVENEKAYTFAEDMRVFGWVTKP